MPAVAWRVHAVRGLVAGLVVVAIAWAALTATATARAVEAARDGQRSLAAVGRTTDVGVLTDPETRASLRHGAAAFERAADELAAPWVGAARWIPVLGRNLSAARSTAEAGSQLADAAADALDELEALGGWSPRSAGRVELAESVADLTARLRSDVAAVDVPDTPALVGPLDSARDRLALTRTRLRRVLDDAAPATRALARVVQGPTKVLVLVVNPAEMRAGSGMVLQTALLSIDEGELTLTDVGPSYERVVPAGAVAADPELDRLWGWADVEREWRNVNLTGRFDVSARLARDMWEATSGDDVDAVIAVDPRALAELVELTGPVEVFDRTLAAYEVVHYLTRRQYVGLDLDRFGTDLVATSDRYVAPGRRDGLGELARVAVARLGRARLEPVEVIERLVALVRSRSLLMWSDDAQLGPALEAVGATGALAPESVAVSVINANGSKLDPYLDVATAIHATAVEDLVDVEVTIELTNGVRPDRVSDYVVGPRHGVRGEYVGWVGLHVPGAALDLRLTDDRLDVVSGTDGPTEVIAVPVTVLPGQTEAVEIAFSLPASAAQVRIEPSGRLRTVEWTVDGDRVGDRARRQVPLAASAR